MQKICDWAKIWPLVKNSQFFSYCNDTWSKYFTPEVVILSKFHKFTAEIFEFFTHVKFCPNCKFLAPVSSIFVKPILKSFSYFRYSFKSAWSLYFINVSTFFLFLFFIICSWSQSLYFPYFLSSFSEIPKIIIHSFVFLYLFYLASLRPVLKFFVQKLLKCCNTNSTTLLSKSLVFWFCTFL